MKKGFLCVVLSLVSTSILAQGRFSSSLEVSAGAGVERGPLVTAAPHLVAQYEIGNCFKIGVGAGVRFACPCHTYTNWNGTLRRTFNNELDIPVFVRLGYEERNLFADVDAGYAIGIFARLDPGVVPGGKKEPSYDGLFVEPQVGVKFGRYSAFALGVLLQQSHIINDVTKVSATMSETKVTHQNVFTPAITLRYRFVFMNLKKEKC